MSFRNSSYTSGKSRSRACESPRSMSDKICVTSFILLVYKIVVTCAAVSIDTVGAHGV